MMCIFQTYQKISNLFNEEKVLEKDNWRDSTIVNILQNEIELDIIGTVIAVKQINFRESICKPCQELFDKGYIDTNKPAIFGNVLGNVRFSNYLSEEEFGEIILRLQQYYDVHFTEATYYV